MFKKEEKDWLHTELDKEKKKVELLKREGRKNEWSTETANQFEEGTGKLNYSKKSEMNKKSAMSVYVLTKVFSLVGFIISWAIFYEVLHFLLRLFYVPFYILAPGVYTIVTFFLWGAIFILLRRKCLEQ